MTSAIILGVLLFTFFKFGELAPPDCLCDNCDGLEQKDDFYNLSSSYGRANRALKGTKKILGVPANQSPFSLTITGSVVGSDFNLTKLCLMTKNVLTIEPGYESSHSPMKLQVDSSTGTVSIGGVGTGLFAERGIRIEDPGEWAKTCVASSGVVSRINLHFTPTSSNAKMMIKALHMRACRRWRRMPPPVCSNRKRLGDGAAYFELTSSHNGAENALSGTNKAVRAPAGQSLSFTIQPPQGDRGFVIALLCIETRNADQVVASYQGISTTRTSSNGRVSGVGPGLSAEAKTLEILDQWTETCVDFSVAMRSQVQLTVSSSDENVKVMVKGLIMKGCPWTS